MRRLFPILGPTAATGLAALALFLIAPYALLVMAPALALAWLVAMGMFTGERAIAWARRALRRAPLRPARQLRSTRRPAPQASRGSALLARSLASRPPPRGALAAG